MKNRNLVIAFILGFAAAFSLGALSDNLADQQLVKWQAEYERAERYQSWFGDPSYNGNEAAWWFFEGQKQKIQHHQAQAVYWKQHGTLDWQ